MEKGSDPDPRTRRLAVVGGTLLLVGTLLPFATDGHHILWPWDSFRFSTEAGFFMFLLPLGLSIAAIVVGRMATGAARSLTLFIGGLLVLVLYGSAWNLSLRFGAGGLRPGGAAGLWFLLPLAAAAVAAGNHLRQGYPERSPPALLAGIGGIVGVVAYFVPGLLLPGHPLVEAFTIGDAWEGAFPLLVFLAGLLAWFSAAIFSFRRVREPAALTTGLSFSARVLAFALPFALLGTALQLGADEILSTLVGFALKLCSQVYGLQILLAAGLIAWLDDRLSRRPRSAPADGLDTLRRRLETLDRALDEGLLTEEEVERKRRLLIDEAEL